MLNPFFVVTGVDQPKAKKSAGIGITRIFFKAAPCQGDALIMTTLRGREHGDEAEYPRYAIVERHCGLCQVN